MKLINESKNNLIFLNNNLKNLKNNAIPIKAKPPYCVYVSGCVSLISGLSNRGEDHKSHIKSSSSEESIRKQHNLQRRPSGNLSTNQLSIFHQQRSGSMNNPSPQTIEQQNNMKSASIAAIVDSQKSKAAQQQQIVQQMLNEKIDTIAGQQQQQQILQVEQNPTSDFHYDTVDNLKSTAIPIVTNQQTQKYGAYHDEAHSFENSMDFLEDVNHFNFEVLETTV